MLKPPPMIKFPSIRSLWDVFLRVLKRFPFSFLFAFAGAISATALVEVSNTNTELNNVLTRITMACFLGLVLSVSATLFGERKVKPGKRLFLNLFVLSFAVLMFFLLNPLKQESDILRFFLLVAAAHLLVSFAPFITAHRMNAFWQYNRHLFIRFLSGVLYSVVLYLGLAAAVGSMNLLFGFQFEWDTFAIIWVWIVGIFHTVYLLSGIPRDVISLQTDTSYPKGLKLFTQFVLIPLASVYVSILLAYEIKIILQGELPKGLVSNLIIGYAVFGMLSILLVWPIRDQEENKWIKSYSKYFYVLLIPLILLLCWAVGVRVEDYGITEQRYFLIVTALWLTFITIYFLVSRLQNIQLIPLSLAVVCLISAWGPQSAFQVSKLSQQSELMSLFGKYSAVSSDNLRALTAKVDSADAERMQNIIRYLVTDHGVESMDEVTGVELAELEGRLIDTVDARLSGLSKKYQIREQIIDSLTVRLKIPSTRLAAKTSKPILRFAVKNSETTNISGFDRMYYLSSPADDGTDKNFLYQATYYKIDRDVPGKIRISDSRNEVVFDVYEMMDKLKLRTAEFEKKPDSDFLAVPEEEMFIEKRIGNVRIRVCFRTVEDAAQNFNHPEKPQVFYSSIILIK